ncbi:MAG: ACT domain-containing protein [Clostridiales bacterium]|nr:MAG: ACT domain-containing protein [Clostridiales bacterium]
MKAVITVTAKDAKGIIAKVSAKCFEYGANIVDISQSVVGEYFAMIMLVSFDEGKNFGEFVDVMNALGKENNLIIQAMHEDIFNSMHRI